MAVPTYGNGSLISSSKTGSKKGPQLFIDEPPQGELFLGFDNYVNVTSEIILNSIPQYAIGLFGVWGTGKTTLLVKIEEKLKTENCNCIQFNAWRYENESTQATIPLLTTILANLYKKMEIEQKSQLDQEKPNKETLRNKIKRILRGLMIDFNVGIPGIGQLDLNYDFSKTMPENEIKELKNENKSIQKTTLQEGLDLILDLLKIIKGANNNDDLKLVMFIDDLDRCTPEKAVGVFESIKAFLNIRGIVFVLGLSQDIVEAAIDVKYDNFNKITSLFKGSEYLRKIIQLYITMPKWEKTKINDYLEYLLKNYDNKEYSTIFNDNKKLISEAVEPNPRELKRLLNSFIVSREIYKGQGIENSKLLAIQALHLRWPDLYDLASTNPESLERIKRRIIE